MQLVIIAGGKGTRLGLENTPKPMVTIGEKPLLEHQIKLAKRYGIKDIFILSGYRADVIFDYFKDGRDFGVNITHIVDPYPLGTAGSVKLLENLIKEKFLVFYGDIMLDFDLGLFLDFAKKKPDAIASLIVHPNDHPYDSDLVEVDLNNQVTAFLAKPHQDDFYYRNLVNAAIYILSPKIFEFIPIDVSQDFGKDIFPKLLSKKAPIYAYNTPEYIKDIGTENRLDKVANDFTSGKIARLNKKFKRKAIFLDRDGVINKDVDNLARIEDFELLDGVTTAIKKINASEYLAIVVTNQPMLAKGFLSKENLYKIHQKLETLLGLNHAYVDAIYYCPHHPEAGFAGEVKDLKIKCHCRKPQPGMLLQAARDFNIDLANSWIVGDREPDIIAGEKADCKTILLSENAQQKIVADFHCSHLTQAVNFILER